ncbi:MAG: sugar kinase [Roseiarcus sp.]|jgi:sugar/nucleoside kinase (ribokinase family)
MSAPRALVVGDVMIDLIVRLEGPIAVGSDRRAKIAERPGGSAANQAVWLAHFGVAVDFVGRVGAADIERESARFRRAGVDAHLAGDATRETGRLIALVDPSGERSFLTDRAANEALQASDIPDGLIESAALIHLSGYSFFAPSPRAAAIDVMRRAKGKPIGVDPASAEFLREVGATNFFEWTRGASMLFPNGEEAEVLAGTEDPALQGERLSACYPLVVVKRGAAGAEAFQGERRWRVAAPPAKSLDSTGAGDAFVAAFLAARLQGEDMEACLRHAAAAGAAATQLVGARPLPPLRVSGERLVR